MQDRWLEDWSNMWADVSDGPCHATLLHPALKLTL